jgi:hypothetical protein
MKIPLKEMAPAPDGDTELHIRKTPGMTLCEIALAVPAKSAPDPLMKLCTECITVLEHLRKLAQQPVLDPSNPATGE